MSADLLRPPAHLSPSESLRLSQQAPAILQSQASWALPWPLSVIFSSETPEKWTIYENLFYACLRTGDDQSASACLEEMKKRFGDNNERVMGLVGLFHEAIAPDQDAIKIILKSYEDEITERPTNMVVRKRHVAFLKSIGKPDGAIASLVDLLDVSPTDSEAWSELASLYLSQGLFAQAIYSLEEVLLITPNAWNQHARLGEATYLSAIGTAANSKQATLPTLVRAMRCFARSIELCNDYLRGYYGLKLTTSKLVDILSQSSNAVTKATDENELPLPSLQTVQKLNELATSKLGEIIRKYSTGDKKWQGYEEAEVIAARALLDKDANQGPR